MASDSLISDPVDPLQSLFGVSLFPRTIKASTSASMPSDPKDLDSIHHFMKFMTLSSPEKLLDEAKAIVDGGSELLKSKFAKFTESVGINRDAVAPEGKENLQERRPGLGHKRPRFTLKPNARPSVSLESSLDIDQLQDPEEFFSAFEKAENAKREIHRQKGGTLFDSDKYDDQSINTRGRRPGILGKSVNYKHRYSLLPPEKNSNLMSSQETLEMDLPGSPSYESQKDKADTDFEAQETNVAGSIEKSEKGLNDILDEFLSKNNEDFDGDGALSLFQERLKLKPIDAGKLSIPNFLDVGRTDFMALGEKLPKARKTLSNISNLAKRLSGEVHVKQKRVGESPISPTASPTPPKIPLGSISLLKKRGSQSSSLRDPFSPLNVDLSEPRNACSGNDIDRQPPKIPVLKELSISGNLESHVENELGRPITPNEDFHTMIPRALDSLDDCIPDKNLGLASSDMDFQPTGSQNDFIERGTGAGLVETSACENTTRCEGSIDSVIAPDRNAENVTDGHEAAVLSFQFNSHAGDSTQIGSDTGVYVHQSHEVEGMPLEAAVPASQEVNIPQLQIVENLYSDQPLLGRPNSDATEDNPVATPIRADIMTTKKSEKLQPEEKGRAKRPRCESREVKALSRRKSLAEAGTSFESGVRRSRRIKTRPLEYWKGERFLYGRVNESLKLIGLKYISPGKGDGKLKVKAYLPSDYKEILDLAARH